jgi:hypothetical protein
MLIKCVKSVPLYGCRFAEGNHYNVDAALGRQMIETQLAVLADVETREARPRAPKKAKKGKQ